ncbi:MAG TPA: alpha/beta fold hydrolase [Planctomycetota bacterium]|nr:alpha/beta fold hydrolase [Planctomycetota bacterium]HRR82317.1 alpha/beta fold hydrolase [Planctomycetota bacterium]HRT95199.1 alpha/beta fold hydrolase [Planctomycetota bacterium]
MRERAVAFHSPARLVGILAEPEPATEARGLGVVFLHGWTGYRVGPHRIFVEAARRLAAAGCHTLRFDFRGRGDSEGDHEATTLDQMIEDARAARRLLAEQPGVRRTFWCGLCSGGNVTLGAASLDKDVDGLILWSTPLFAPDKTAHQEVRRRGLFLGEYLRKLFRRETYVKLIRGRLRFGLIARVLLGRRRPAAGARDPRDSARHIMRDLRGYHGPALFIYGSRDDEAVGAPEFYRRYCEENGIPAAFHTIEGANHSFYSVAWQDEVIGLTERWLLAAGGK